MDNAVLDLLLTARYVGGPAFAQMRGDMEGLVATTDGLSRMGNAFKAVGDTMVVAGVAMAAGVFEAVKAATAYDDAINRIVAVTPGHLQGITDTTGALDAHTASLIKAKDQLHALRAEMADAAVQWGQQPQAIATGSYYLTSSLTALYGDKAGTTGVNDLLKNNIIGLLSQYSRASGPTDAGGVSYEQAAQDLPRLFTAFNMPMKDWGGGMGMLTYLENNAHLTQQQLVQSMTKFTPVGTALNMGFNDSAILMAALASSGVTGSRAGTEAGSGLYHLFGGTKSSMAGLSALGLDPSKLFDKQGNILSPDLWMPTIAGELAQMKPVDRLNTEHNLLGIVGGRGFGGLLNTGMQRYEDLYSGAKTAGVLGSTKQSEQYLNMIALAQMNSPKAQFESLTAAVKLFGIAVGEAALPYVMQFVTWLRNALVAATGFINKLHDEGLSKFVSDLQKTHPLLAGIVGFLERIGGAIEKAFSGKGGGLGGFLGSMLHPQGGSGLGAALALGPLGLIAGGLGMHALGAGMLFGGPHLFGGPSSPGTAALGLAGKGLGAGAGWLGGLLGNAFGAAGGGMAHGLGGLFGMTGLGSLLPFSTLRMNTGEFGGLGADLTRHRNRLDGLFGGMFGGVGSALGGAFPELHKFNTMHDLGLTRGTENWAGALFRDAGHLGGGAMGGLRGLLGAAGGGLGAARGGLGALGDGLGAAGGGIAEYLRAPGYYHIKAGGAIGEAGRGGMEALGGGMKGVASAAGDLAKNVGGTLMGAFNNLPGMLAKLGSGGFGLLKTGITGLLPALAGLGSALLPIIAIGLAVAGAITVLVLMFTRYRNEMQPVIQMLGSVFGPMFRSIGGMIKTTAEDIGKAWTKMAPDIDKAMKQFIAAIIQAKPVFEMIAAIIKLVVGIIIAIIGNLIKAFINILPSIIGVFTFIVKVVTDVVNIFHDGWGKLPENIKKLFGDIFGLVGNAVGAILGFIGGFVTGMGEKLRDLTKNIPIVGGFVQAIGAVLGGIGDAIGGFVKGIGDAVGQIVKFFRNVMEKGLEVAAAIPGPWQDSAKKMLQSMKDADAEEQRQEDAKNAALKAKSLQGAQDQAAIAVQGTAQQVAVLKDQHDKIVAQMNATTDDAKRAALAKQLAVVDAYQKEAIQAQLAAQDEANKVFDALVSVEGKAAAAGETVSANYANAILAHESQAAANARALAQAAANAMGSVPMPDYTGRGFAGGAGRGNISGYAEGGVTPGGLVRVGEKGWEYAMLPQGTHVFSHSESMNMLQNVQLGLGGRGGSGRISDLHVDNFHLPDGAFPQQQSQQQKPIAPEYQLMRQIQAQREANTGGYDRRSGFDNGYRYGYQWSR